MTELELTSWFRRRMAALVASISLVAAAVAPVVYHLEKRAELVTIARADAARVAAAIADLVHQRQQFWRYDASKLAERLAGEGLDRLAALSVRDASGRAVGVDRVASSPQAPLLWGMAHVEIDGRREATVWVAADATALHRGTALLSVLSALVWLVLGALLYQVPVRVIARAERRIAGLMGQLALTMQEGERSRIARDLHDGAGQALTAARLQLLSARKRADGDAARAPLEAAMKLIDEALDEVRRSTTALMPPSLAELGLLGAIERHAEAFGQASGVRVRCELSTSLPRLEPHAETALYRIVQEALTNVARHADASDARVCLKARGGEVCLTVEDNGRGIEGDRKGGSGLDSIAERARLVGGKMSVENAGSGTRLTVRIPSA